MPRPAPMPGPTEPLAVALGASAATLGAALLARERRGRRRAERLAAALSETLLNAIDATDAETGAHVRRVAHYALILAKACGADDALQHEIERVALFHDIGKIHEALFDIIHEGTRLSADERRAIATHPARGAAVLAPLADFYPGLPAGVLAHHERWDGTGYPRGLAGTRIPYPARVVALADTFDAITHYRRYSRARGLREAAAAIRAGRGTQFDPALVDRMIAADVLQSLMDDARREAAPGTRRDRRRASAALTSRGPDVSFRWRDEAPPPPPPVRRRSARPMPDRSPPAAHEPTPLDQARRKSRQ
jgi:HD-GYP domain-containing protein (c-di-GMP phosphodiesterase class II)